MRRNERSRMASDTQRERGLLDAKGASELLNVPASWVAAEARAGRTDAR